MVGASNLRNMNLEERWRGCMNDDEEEDCRDGNGWEEKEMPMG